MIKKMSFIAACKDYFGMKPDQTLTGFASEMRALSNEDKAYFTALFPSVGYEILT